MENYGKNLNVSGFTVNPFNLFLTCFPFKELDLGFSGK